MKYVIAILFPCIGMLLVGKVLQAIICLILQVVLIGWPIAAIWACFVVSGAEREKQTNRIISAMNK